MREARGEIGYAGGDIIADQPHPFDPVDPALGGFVGVPVFESCAGHGLHLGFAAQRDHDVDIVDHLGVNEFGRLIGDVDTYLSQ